MLDVLVRHWPLKLLAVVIAFAIWVGVIGENRVVQDFRVPLDIVLRKEVMAVGDTPTTVTVRLRGPETLLRRVDALRLEAKLDLRDAPPGERSVLLSSSEIRGVPRGLDIASIEPDRLRLSLDKRARSTVPVVPVFVGRPEAGYHFYGSLTTPERLEVEGPRASVAGVSRLRTDPVHLEGHYQPFTARVGAQLDQPDLKVVDPAPVEVRVLVDEAPEDRTFDGVPVTVTDQLYEVQASPPAVRLVVSGPPALLDRLQAFQLRAVASVRGLAPAARPYAVPLRLDFKGVPPEDAVRLSLQASSHPKAEVRVSDRRIPR